MQKRKKFKWKTEMVGDIFIMNSIDIKPNYSAIARKYGINRATVKKYFEAGGIPMKKEIIRKSKYDEYDELIKEKMSDSTVKISALYQYMLNMYEDKINFTYSGLKAYVERKGYRTIDENIVPHVLYETPEGEQLQCDWKEDLSIHTIDGKIISFNIFSATLGYSRLHVFIFTFTKTEYDFFRCLIYVFKKIGGLPKIVKTDNMTAIVSLRNGSRKKHPAVLQFEKDLGIKISLCEPRSPETKGKVEVSNKFMDWLRPYDGEVKDVDDLIRIINIINKQCNNQINDRTHIPPIKLFQREKEYLSPLPSNILLDSYIKNIDTQEVLPTLLVSYKGSKYSVPKKYIGKKVQLVSESNELYIYFNTELIACHDINTQNTNYDEAHYSEALATRLKVKQDEVEEIAKANLERFKKLEEIKNEF